MRSSRLSAMLVGLDLRRLILFLALTGVVLVFIGGLHASYRVQKIALIESSLQANYTYATKLSATISDFLRSAQQQLKYTSHILASDFQNTQLLQAEANRLKNQTDSFNSIVIIDRSGLVLATDPDIGLTGSIISSPALRRAIEGRVPQISDPYIATTGRLLVVISEPVFGLNGDYLGLVSGTIYLAEPSILNRMLGIHFYQEGSYLYIVDRSGVLLSHPQTERVGTRAHSNKVTDEIAIQNSGMMTVVSGEGQEMLAGYSVIPDVGWGVVSQQSTEFALSSLSALFTQVLETTLPLVILTAIFIWWFSKVISKPLHQLAESASKMDNPDSTNVIHKTHAWYFETANLKQALLVGIQLLQEKIFRLDLESKTDALTGLNNRRTFDVTMQRMFANGRHFSLVSIDVDHFKLVNDRFGHAVGDEVLKKLAALLVANFRAEDLVCRIGGEEFSILVADLDVTDVYRIAERLRQSVENTVMDPVGNITVSIGIAQWPNQAKSIKEVISLSDEMLYAAKRNGRNRVEMMKADSL